jgi:hypothetical protein
VPSLLDVESARNLPATSLAALVRGISSAAAATTGPEAFRALAEASRAVTAAEIAVIRIPDESGERLEAAAVAAPPTLAAELEGTVVPLAELPAGPVTDLASAPAAARHAAERAGATRLLLLPAAGDGCAISLELLRRGEPFSVEERLAGELSAAFALLVLRAFGGGAGPVESLARPALELAGEALAAALDEGGGAAEVLRLAAAVVGATAGVVWERRDGELVAAATCGIAAGADLAAARELAERTLADPGPVRALAGERLPEGCGISTTLPLGRPALGVLQLLHPPGDEPDPEQLGRLATFGVRAANALRAGERARLLAVGIGRTAATL